MKKRFCETLALIFVFFVCFFPFDVVKAGGPDSEVKPAWSTDEKVLTLFRTLSVSTQNRLNKLALEFRDNTRSCKTRFDKATANQLDQVNSFIDLSPSKEQNTLRFILGYANDGNVLYINSYRLREFLCRCKSSLNGAMLKLGFHSQRISMASEPPECLKKSDRAERRQWSRRTKFESAKLTVGGAKTPSPNSRDCNVGQTTTSNAGENLDALGPQLFSVPGLTFSSELPDSTDESSSSPQDPLFIMSPVWDHPTFEKIPPIRPHQTA